MAASTSGHSQRLEKGQTQKKTANKPGSRKGKGKENANGGLNSQVGQTSNRSWDNLGSDPSWEWSTITDSASRKVAPVFTKDGSYFFSFAGASIKIHSTTTGQVVSTLSLPQTSRQDVVTCATINPHNAFQLITGSLNGSIVVWDFLGAVPLQTIDISQPIYHLCVHESFQDTAFVAVGRPFHKAEQGGSDDNCVVMRVSLVPQSNTTKSSEIRPVGKTRSPTGLVISPDGEWLVATAGHKVYVAPTSSSKSGFTKYVSPERITCLAFHPSDQYFATGDAKGCIRMWYCLGDNLQPPATKGVEKKTRTTTLHWHAHAVASIAFTPNGAYLLSGGEEAVLVIWQLHSGKKEFVPRVGAPINSVSISKSGASEEEYLLELSDATHVFVSSGTLRISRSYPRLKIDPATVGGLSSPSSNRTAPLGSHSLSSTLILPSSHPCSLQIYSPSSSKLISELEISPASNISRREEKPLDPPYVSRIVTSPSDDWLASVDVRDDSGAFKGEIYLKFWSWDKNASRWVLNSRVDRPHGLKMVTDMAFSPNVRDSRRCLLVTTGEDQRVRVWDLKTLKSKSEGSKEFWVPHSTFDYRSQTPYSVSWSPDGSLLAIAFETCIAVYDSASSVLLTRLTTSDLHASVRAQFVGHGGRYIAAVGGHDLALWDLVTKSIRWTHKLSSPIEHLTPHPKTGTFALLHGNSSTSEGEVTRVSIFDTSSSTPSTSNSIPFRIRSASPCPFLGAVSQHTFIGITQDWSLVVFGNKPKVKKEDGTRANKISSQGQPHKRTLFQDIFGQSALTSPPEGISVDFTRLPQSGSPTNVFDTPAYLMPPISAFSDALLNSFLQPRQEKVVTGQEDLDGDFEMDVDEVPGISSKAHVRQTVSAAEMQTFVELFKKHSFRDPSSYPNSHTNGVSVSKPTLFSKQDTPMKVATSSVKTLMSTSAPAAPASPIPSPTSPLLNGKKRKKP